MTTRRSVFGAAAGAALAFGQARDRKLKIGVIGAGWYGMVDMNAAWKAGNVECVAIADADSEHASKSADECEKAQGSRPKTHKDYRELLGTRDLDAVIIATPPHWHALQFIDACRKGLPVYLEKPVSYDVREGIAMRDAWKKAGNVVQVGFQRRQPGGYMHAKKLIEGGAAGRIVQVDAQIHYRAAMLDSKPQDPPATLDWNLWCGPAPLMSWSPNRGHRTWRLEKEVGNGHLVDWGIHVIDAARTILDDGTPRSVHAAGGLYEYKGQITTPDTLTAHFEFDRCPIVWRHRLWGAAEFNPEISNGLLFYGDKATIFATDARCVVIPRGKGERQVVEAPESREAGQNHMRDFLEAVRAERQPSCTLDDAVRSTQTVQLAMISYDSGTPVQWDAAKETVVNNAAAAKLLRRKYRAPYQHPAGRASMR